MKTQKLKKKKTTFHFCAQTDNNTDSQADT